MTKSKNIQRVCVSVVTVAILAGCAAPGGKGGASSDDCNTAVSAAVGGGIALLLNAALGGDPRNNVQAAAVGAAFGAGMCLYVKSQQVKTAAQVDADYRQRNGALPPEPKVVSYSTASTSPTVRRGDKFEVNSNFELVNGSRTKVTDVKEELTLIDSNGKILQSGSKPVAVKSDEVKTAGAYNNRFTLTIPKNIPEGKYNVQTKLFVNGNELAHNSNVTQMVWDGTTATVLASR